MNSLQYLFQGFLFGIAYVAPIGIQNLFVINLAINNAKIKSILKIILIVIFFDISLALACFFGIGILFTYFPLLKLILLFFGLVFILYLSLKLLISTKGIEFNNNFKQVSFVKTIFLCFSVAWLNPQAIIDGTLLFGGMRAVTPAGYLNVFIIGTCLASIIWFNALAVLANKAIKKLTIIIKYINKICGIIFIFYGIKLGYELFINVKEVLK